MIRIRAILTSAAGLTFISHFHSVQSAAFAGSYTVNPVEDVRILDIYKTANFKGDFISVYSAVGNMQRTLMRFDLSQVPSNERATAATLTLTASLSWGYANDKPMEVYRLTRPWTEEEATWAQASAGLPWTVEGGDYVGTDGSTSGPPYAVTVANPKQDLELVTWDITALVNAWLDGAPNYGLLLLSSDGNYLTFRSQDATEPTRRPVLRIQTGSSLPVLKLEREPVVGAWSLSWDGVGTAVLQERIHLGTASAWVDSTLTPATVNGRSRVVFPATGASRFFRLRQN